jgi:hypothetical protein
MKQRKMILGGMLLGSLLTTLSAQATSFKSTASPAPAAMPEPASLAELGMGLSALLGYAWWRVSRRKRSDS